MPQVLLVDDDPEAVEWLTEFIRAEGYTVGMADSLRAARIHLTRSRPEVILTDLVLPDGQRVWLGAKPDGGEDVDGYDLRAVTIGAEGMLGVVTQVLVRLIKAPRAYRTVVAVLVACLGIAWLVVLDAGNPTEAVRLRAERLVVVSKGKIVSRRARNDARLALPGRPETVRRRSPRCGN